MRRIDLAVLIAAGVSAGVLAQAYTAEFRDALERELRPGRACAVVIKPGLPTGRSSNADPTKNIVLEIRDGRAWTLAAILGKPPRLENFLYEGEVLRIAAINYRAEAIDLRFTSIDAHKLTQGTSEPVVTTFRLVLPESEDLTVTQKDVPRLLTRLEPYLQLFPDEPAARKFAPTLGRR